MKSETVCGVAQFLKSRACPLKLASLERKISSINLSFK